MKRIPPSIKALVHLNQGILGRSCQRGKRLGVYCVFNPHCKYIPHLSDENPGRMFKGIKKLKRKFPDVFPCYLEEYFSTEKATMFRFPLKKKKMAKESWISRTPVTVEKLDEKGKAYTAFFLFHLKLASQSTSMATLHWIMRPNEICGEVKLVAIKVTATMLY